MHTHSLTSQHSSKHLTLLGPHPGREGGVPPAAEARAAVYSAPLKMLKVSIANTHRPPGPWLARMQAKKEEYHLGQKRDFLPEDDNKGRRDM